MAIPVWSADLPQRGLIDGYSETFRDGRLQSRTSTGPGKVRRRVSSAPMPVVASMVVTYSQKSRLERLWNEESAGGSLPFIMPDQSHDGIPILTAGGVPLHTAGGIPVLITAKWLVIFASPPQLTPWGIQWSAAMQLNVMP